MIEQRWVIIGSGEIPCAGAVWVQAEHSSMWCKLQYRYNAQNPIMPFIENWSEWQDVAPPSVTV